MDSNHRSETQQIYSLPPLATREPLRIIGAGDGTRTRNLLITNQLLCQLSYTSLPLVVVVLTTNEHYYTTNKTVCQHFFEIFLNIFLFQQIVICCYKSHIRTENFPCFASMIPYRLEAHPGLKSVMLPETSLNA